MLNRKDYDVICANSNELKEPFSLEFHPKLREKLGESVSGIFPQFAQAFPLTVNAIEHCWPRPIGAFYSFRNRWQPSLVCEKEDLNLFFDIRVPSAPLDGPLYDQSHSMLPVRWKELYRYFESFTITEKSTRSMNWWNTPFNYPSRLNLDDYREGSGATKVQIKSFIKKIGSDRLICWLLTEAGDALFLDEARNDHKVYHVRGTDFDNVYALENPEDILDKYLAHYVSGGSPADFDFRAVV